MVTDTDAVAKIDCGAWLKSLAADQPLHWYPNPGNAGDHLIAAATASLFRRHGIEYRVITDPDQFDSRGKLVCFGGGGNLVSRYTSGRKFVERHHANAARFVILPHSVEGNHDLLAALSPRVTIICREAVSYAHCRSAAANAQILAADDIALSLIPGTLLGWSILSSALQAFGVYRSFRPIFVRFKQARPARAELDVWRNDREANPRRSEAPANDLSQLFSLSSLDIQRSQQSVDKLRVAAHYFLRTIDLFPLVRTDRLHVAIAGAILGKKVELYENDYYKNRAVYEFSLRGFSNVRFCEWT